MQALPGWLSGERVGGCEFDPRLRRTFKFDENSRKFSKRVENTVGKGELARYEQFLLFPSCSQKTSTADT